MGQWECSPGARCSCTQQYMKTLLYLAPSMHRGIRCEPHHEVGRVPDERPLIRAELMNEPLAAKLLYKQRRVHAKPERVWRCAQGQGSPTGLHGEGQGQLGERGWGWHRRPQNKHTRLRGRSKLHCKNTTQTPAQTHRAPATRALPELAVASPRSRHYVERHTCKPPELHHHGTAGGRLVFLCRKGAGGVMEEHQWIK